MSKANQTAWTEMTQPNAATYARSMYSGNNNYEVDLINSYSWDTAIAFIQKYSGNSNYANQTTGKSGSSAFATGTSGDMVCNIHDMASNCREWSTEHSTYTSSSYTDPCVTRGVICYSTNSYTAFRVSSQVTYSHNLVSFRVVLY